MFCKNCGNEIKENSRFCDSCGTPVISPETEVINKFTEKNTPAPTYIAETDKKISAETVSESADIKEAPLRTGEIILHFLEYVISIPQFWLASFFSIK